MYCSINFYFNGYEYEIEPMFMKDPSVLEAKNNYKLKKT